MSRRRGFSLAEVLVAGTGTVLLMGLLLGAMSTGSRAVARDEGGIAAQSEALGAVERVFATLRLSHSGSITVLEDPPALAFLTTETAGPAPEVPTAAFALTAVQTEPLAWSRFRVFYHDAAAKELRCADLAYPMEQRFMVASLHPEWLATALAAERDHKVAARSVEAVHFGRTRPPGVDIDLTVLREHAGQKQETRLKLYVTTRNG